MEGPEGQVPAKSVHLTARQGWNKIRTKDEQVDGLFTAQEEKDHEVRRQFNRKQILRWKQENSILAKRLIEDETTVARVGIPISEEDP